MAFVYLLCQLYIFNVTFDLLRYFVEVFFEGGFGVINDTSESICKCIHKRVNRFLLLFVPLIIHIFHIANDVLYLDADLVLELFDPNWQTIVETFLIFKLLKKIFPSWWVSE